MRKRLVGLSAFMIVFVVLMMGCNSSSNKSDVDHLIGTWSWSKLVINGVTWSPLNPSVLTPGGSTAITPGLIQQLDPNARLSVTVTFNEDKSVVGTVNATIPGQPAVAQSGTGTWSVTNDVLTINFRNGSTTNTASGVFSISGSTLTIAISNQQLRDILNINHVDLSSLTPSQRDLVMTLSGTIEFTK